MPKGWHSSTHGWGPPGRGGSSRWYGKKGWHGPPHRRPRWGLRRRFTFAFAFVALAAVTITTWFTLGAVFEAQRALFESVGGSGGALHPDDPGFGIARQAFGRITRTAFVAGLLSFSLASVAAGVVTRLLTRPLIALTDAAHRLEAGERGLRLTPPAPRDELRTLTEAFNNLGAGLERQEAWRRALVADIAHDLRTPLSVLRSEIEAMQDGVVATDPAALERLHAEVLRLSKLVDDLRTLSLAEGGGMTPVLEMTELAPFLEGVCDSFTARAGEVGTRLWVEAPAGLSVPLDRDRLHRLLSNLVDNALYHAAPGEVVLGAAAEPGWLRVTVRDDGPGLSDEALERAFERFYRGDPSRTRLEGGGSSGLGLAIARAIAEALGGRLEAENRAQGGALFTLLLPDATHGDVGGAGGARPPL